jgi:hypothetical protein
MLLEVIRHEMSEVRSYKTSIGSSALYISRSKERAFDSSILPSLDTSLALGIVLTPVSTRRPCMFLSIVLYGFRSI